VMEHGKRHAEVWQLAHCFRSIGMLSHCAPRDLARAGQQLSQWSIEYEESAISQTRDGCPNRSDYSVHAPNAQR
jgi:hypothetical protein